jgi:Sec-independent protein secretion pathway component TatC
MKPAVSGVNSRVDSDPRPPSRNRLLNMPKVTETPTGNRLFSNTIELRSRLLKAAVSVLVVLLALLPFSRKLYEVLA